MREIALERPGKMSATLVWRRIIQLWRIRVGQTAMPSPAIENVKARFREQYGQDALSPYTPDDEHGTCFIVRGIPATFSVHTQAGALPFGQYDVQVEDSPPGEYLVTGVMNLDRLMELAARVAGPRSQWPSSW